MLQCIRRNNNDPTLNIAYSYSRFNDIVSDHRRYELKVMASFFLLRV
jgi:hypothetical protein